MNRENERLLKNAIFSLFGLFTNFMNLKLEEFSIDQWYWISLYRFSRFNSGSLYYDEIGIGGTISHVTSEYGSHIDMNSLPKNEMLHSILFHRILRVFLIVLPMLKLYSKNFEKVKRYIKIDQINYW